MLDPLPSRVITVGSGTIPHPLSKLCSEAIKHLVNPTNLPRNNISTKHEVFCLIFINEEMTPLPAESVLALADIRAMYPSVNIEEAVQEVKRRLEEDPSTLGLSASTIAEGLRLCIKCNCVQFRGRFYIPCKGCAQGNCHACTFTDIWVGKIVDKHIRTSNIDSVFFTIYRDDALDILKRGKVDEPALRQELDLLHPDVKWDVTCEMEGGFLDMFIMIKNGRIEWKTYTKTPPLYLSKISCHDPQIFKGIPKGVGYRLRLTNSTKETFRENVELYSRSMALSG